jgi:predicted transglutaminase-like cysteine proteinase
MFGHVAARSLAILLVLSLPVLAGSATAFAQYQANASAAAITTAEAAAPSRQAARDLEPFGLDALPVTGGEILNKWRGLVADMRAESDILTRCRTAALLCPAAAQKFLAVIADGRAHEGRARIGVINRAINLAIRPTSDLAQWGVADRWSAPLATLATGRGDCEDYAIAKYVALTEAGVSADNVKLIIVRDLAGGADHAVVAARLDEKWIVLDNRRLALIEDVEMPRVLPLFALGHDGVKQFVATSLAEAHGAEPPGEATAPAPAALRF